MYQLRNSIKTTSSRKQIQIKSVRDGTLILKNSYVDILECSSINFELMSEEEQDYLIDGYQAFLNSLTTDVQILTRSRQIDIEKYLDNFRYKNLNEESELFKNQANRYVEFISELTNSTKIITRKFYIIFSEQSSSEDFYSIKEKLSLKKELVSSSINRLGIFTKSLDSLETLDLFYSFYSPLKSKVQPLKNRTIKLINGANL